MTYATMPQDGSGRLTVAERILYAAVAVACAVSLAWVAVLLSGITPGGNSGHDQAKIIQGSYLTWQVANDCAQNSAECSHTLDTANRELAPYGLKIFNDGSIAAR